MNHFETNSILAKPIANLDNHHIFKAYKELFETLEAKGYKPKMNVLDNQATRYIIQFLTKQECNSQMVETHNQSTQQRGLFKHSRTHSLWPKPQLIVIFPSICGIN
jgi:hypothetical protein